MSGRDIALNGQALKITFVIRSLENGGAERQLTVLANELADRGHAVSIIVFYSGGDREADVRQDHVRLIDIGKRSRWDLLPFLWRLLRTIRAERPDIMHGYLSAGNLAVTLARLIQPAAKVVWGIRDSYMAFENYSLTTQFTYRLAFFASRFADLMIFNSRAGLLHWRKQGCRHANTVCISNGIDTAQFAPDAAARRRMRDMWGVSPATPLIGMVGRLDPVKDHENFVRAAGRISAELPDARFVCVGGTKPDAVARLERLAVEAGAGGKFIWPGALRDMRAVYNAFDVLCFPSAYGEGFPNVVGEAMACGRPCVVTDVGDAALILGDLGRVVQPGDFEALARGILLTLECPPARTAEIRQRIVDNFSPRVLADRTEEVLGLARTPAELATVGSLKQGSL